MGCICGMATFGDIRFDYNLWTHVYDEDKKRHVRKAIEEEKKFLAEKIIKVEDSRKIDIIKRYLSEYEYLLDEMPKHDFKPFERVLVRRTNQERWKLHLFSRESGEDNKYECLGGVGFSQCRSSTESSQAVAWYVVFSSGLTGTGNKHIGDMVRTVIDF